MANWTASDIPRQRGRTAVVTGTGGLGYETALALARAGGDVVIAGRNPAKGAEAVARIRGKVTDAKVRFEALDLASLGSIAAFGARMRAEGSGLDLLVNNAAVMMPPQRRVTTDGFELQFGTNYLGHFALTAELLPLLRAGRDPRVVTLSSIAANNGVIDLDDLQAARAYKAMPAYNQSKLACLMFAFELQRRSAAAGWSIASIAAHPGISRTELLPNGGGRMSPQGLARRILWFLFQPAAHGAWPALFAATDPAARGGSYYGPARLGETRGSPTSAKIPPRACDLTTAARLWTVSETLTGLSV